MAPVAKIGSPFQVVSEKRWVIIGDDIPYRVFHQVSLTVAELSKPCDELIRVPYLPSQGLVACGKLP